MKAMSNVLVLGAFAALGLLAFACSEDAGSKATAARTDAGADAGETFTTGDELRIPVAATGRVYVKLASPPAIVTPADPMTDLGWDLAFEGLDVFTNSGPSGAGSAEGFGPVDAIVFLDDVAPQVPFLTGDKTGGAFLRWYFYEGPPNHALDSRFHVYGIKDGAKLYKVQLLSYYGDRAGAPVSALFRVRWAEVTPGGTGPVQDVAGIDGTAGGPTGTPDSPSECLDLATGAKLSLSPTAARASSAWHLCFRRENISVNGELGGPRGVSAVDFDAEKTATEKLVDILNMTPESEQARFDAITAASFDGQTLRGDRVVSAFSGLWIEKGSSPPAPRRDAWFIVGADGLSKYVLGFARFEGATAQSPGTVVMRVKTVK
jgi:hypothetical protein